MKIKKIISLFMALLFSVNVFAQTGATGTGLAGVYTQTQSAVRQTFKCDLKKYPTGANCDCHSYVYQQNIKNSPLGGGGHGAGGATGAANLAMQRRCMHAANPHYSDYGEYQNKLTKIPQSLISPSEDNHGDIQAQYLFNQETANAYFAARNQEKADEYFGKNVEILIANMMQKSWAAKLLLKNLYKGNLSAEEKEAALETLKVNLPNVGRCQAGICQVPGTVGDVSELFTNCGQDACLFTALHVELFSSLIQSGATGVTNDEAIGILSNMLVKEIGNDNNELKRFGDKQANTTVKIPILKAILELGNEDYYMEVTKSILEKDGVLSYANSDSEVISFIIDTYSSMNKYDPLINYAFGKNTNVVTRTEAMIALANMSSPDMTDPSNPGAAIDILEEDEKQKIANFLHMSYSDKTTACVVRNQEGQRVNGRAVLAGMSVAGDVTSTDAILKQRMCEAYTNLGVQSNLKNRPCYPCEGNLDADGGIMVAEMALSFVLDSAVDDVVFAVLTLGAGLVATKMIKGAKYAAKANKLRSKISKAKQSVKIFTDKVVAGVRAPRKTRAVKRARKYVMTTLDDGTTVAKWADNVGDGVRSANAATDVGQNANRARTAAGNGARGGQRATRGATAAQPNVGTRVEQEAREIGNQFTGTGDLPGVRAKGDVPSAHGDVNLPNRPATVATQEIPKGQLPPNAPIEDVNAFRASQQRVALKEERIAAIDAEIEEQSKGLGRFLHKDRIEELRMERNALSRQADIDTALSNPRIKIEKTQHGYVASADGVEAPLSQAELDRYLKDLSPEDLDNFYKRNPNLKPEADNVADVARRADEIRPNGESPTINTTLKENMANAEIPARHKGELDDIFESIGTANANTSLTPTQRQGVERATEYFNNLTPQQLADESLYTSAAFRENAARLKSPAATEHGFFIDANGGISAGAVEEGYIPHMISNGDADLSFGDVRQLFSSAERTDKPIFVRLDVHGEIDDAGKFYFIFGDVKSKNIVYPEELTDALQQLRRTTGAPEIDLYSGACHSGQFLDEFAKLPASQREGINIFATAGAPLQVNSTGNVGLVRARGMGSIKDAQLDNIVNTVIGEKGNIFARGYVNGEIFDPLSQALSRANADPNKYGSLIDRLEVLNNLHKSTDGSSIRRTINVDYQIAGGEWSPSLMLGNAFDTECMGMDQDIVNFVKETAQQMRSGTRW